MYYTADQLKSQRLTNKGIIAQTFKKPIFSIVLLALFVFILVSLGLQLFTNAFSSAFIPSDSYGYIKASHLLYSGFELHPFGQIGYSFLIGIPNILHSKPSLNHMILWNYGLNFVLWVITILTLFAALRMHLNKRGSLMLTVLFIGCVGNIANVAVILTEPLTCCIITLIGFQLLSYKKKKSHLHLAYAVALINFVVLVRPGMLYLAILYNVIFVCYLLKYRVSPTLKMVLPIICLVSVIFIQALFNYTKNGNFTVSYIDKHAWYLYLGAETKAEAQAIPFLEERNKRRKIFNTLSLSEQHTLAGKDFKEQFNNHPQVIFKNYATNIIDNILVGNLRISGADDYRDVPYFNYIRYYLYLISKAQNVIFSVLGIFVTLFIIIRYRFLSLPLLMSCGIICYIILTSGVSFWEGDRFNLVFYPLTLIVLSYFLSQYRWFKKREIQTIN